MTMIKRVARAIRDRDIAWYVERYPEHEEAIRKAAMVDLEGNYAALAKAALDAAWEAMEAKALKDEA